MDFKPKDANLVLEAYLNIYASELERQRANKLGEFVHNYRIEHHLSLREFGELCCISYQYIANLEKGYNKNGTPISPSLNIYKKIANAVGIDVMELISNVSPEATQLSSANTKSPDYGYVEQIMRILPPEELSKLRQIVETLYPLEETMTKYAKRVSEAEDFTNFLIESNNKHLEELRKKRESK